MRVSVVCECAASASATRPVHPHVTDRLRALTGLELHACQHAIGTGNDQRSSFGPLFQQTRGLTHGVEPRAAGRRCTVGTLVHFEQHAQAAHAAVQCAIGTFADSAVVK